MPASPSPWTPIPTPSPPSPKRRLLRWRRFFSRTDGASQLRRPGGGGGQVNRKSTQTCTLLGFSARGGWPSALDDQDHSGAAGGTGTFAGTASVGQGYGLGVAGLPIVPAAHTEAMALTRSLPGEKGGGAVVGALLLGPSSGPGAAGDLLGRATVEIVKEREVESRLVRERGLVEQCVFGQLVAQGHLVPAARGPRLAAGIGEGMTGTAREVVVLRG